MNSGLPQIRDDDDAPSDASVTAALRLGLDAPTARTSGRAGHAALDVTTVGESLPRGGEPLDVTTLRTSGPGRDLTTVPDIPAAKARLELTAPSVGQLRREPRLDVTAATASTVHAGALPESALERTVGPSSDVSTTRRGSPAAVTEIGASADAAIEGGDAPLPRQIGRYPVLRRLGSGGMGTVYAAFDEALARRIAVKMLHVGLHLPPGVRAPIIAEAQAMARLSHANVVQVYELGEHEGGLFLAMEYVEGRTLTDWLKEQARSWPEIVRIFLAAGEGLAAAHRAGIIHGDFKPDNVLVDRAEVPRVADFGLARVASEGPGLVAGTPAYMAPEQLLGAPSDAPSDQFSFCVALYAALYGQAPFAGDTFAELTHNVTTGALRAPPPRTGVPAGLHAALVAGLATDAARRHPSLDALLAALREHLPDQTGTSRAAWLVASVLAAALLIAFMWSRGGPTGPTIADMSRIAQRALVALGAAARAEWVYPGERSDPQATAIRALVALERLPAPAGDYARARADHLRTVLAGDLAALGDRYWDDERTRPFARDFYAQTLIFRPDHDLALRRSRLTVGQLADLRDQAEESGFTPEQLEAAAPLKILATTTDPAVIAALVADQERCSEPVPAAIGGAAPAGHAPTEPPPEPTPEPTAPPPEPAAPPPEPAPTQPAAKPPAPRAVDTSALIEEAENARRTGQDGRASTLFRKALALDPGESIALAGLSDIAFDRGDFNEAADLATRAIRSAPEIAEHHTRLGDARFKLDQIPEARAQYKRAIALGDPRAQRRLDLLDRPPATERP